MSSTSSSPTLTSATDSAAASATTSGSSGSGGFSPPSSTLYLLTFLATLFVLLFVSCAIVLRSFLIRRRFRRHIEQQIAAGILPPDALDPHPKRDFGEKPKLWDVYVEPQDVKGLVEYDGWEDVLPMSARITHDPSIHSNEGKTTPSSSHPESTQPASTPVIHPPRYWNLAQLFRRPSRYQLPSDASISSVVEDTSPPEITPDQDIQVAVMVAMPSQSHRHESLPEILIGMSTVPVKGD